MILDERIESWKRGVEGGGDDEEKQEVLGVVESVLLSQEGQWRACVEPLVSSIKGASFGLDVSQMIFGLDFGERGVARNVVLFMEACLDFLSINHGAWAQILSTRQKSDCLHFANADLYERLEPGQLEFEM